MLKTEGHRGRAELSPVLVLALDEKQTAKPDCTRNMSDAGRVKDTSRALTVGGVLGEAAERHDVGAVEQGSLVALVPVPEWLKSISSVRSVRLRGRHSRLRREGSRSPCRRWRN